MSYFIVHTEHQVILGTTEAPYASFTNQFIEASEAQITRYEQLQSVLPPDVYLELSDIIKPNSTTPNRESVTATPATLAAVKSLFRTRN